MRISIENIQEISPIGHGPEFVSPLWAPWASASSYATRWEYSDDFIWFGFYTNTKHEWFAHAIIPGEGETNFRFASPKTWYDLTGEDTSTYDDADYFDLFVYLILFFDEPGSWNYYYDAFYYPRESYLPKELI